MSGGLAQSGLRFGSVRRAGRDSPEYQADRARSYAEFAFRLLSAQRQQLAAREGKLRELWEGNSWLEAQRTQLSTALAGDEARIAELRAWAAELQSARDYANAESATRLEMLGDLQARLDAAERAASDAARQAQESRQRCDEWAREMARLRAHPLLRFAALLGLLRIPNGDDAASQGDP